MKPLCQVVGSKNHMKLTAPWYCFMGMVCQLSGGGAFKRAHTVTVSSPSCRHFNPLMATAPFLH